MKIIGENVGRHLLTTSTAKARLLVRVIRLSHEDLFCSLNGESLVVDPLEGSNSSIYRVPSRSLLNRPNESNLQKLGWLRRGRDGHLDGGSLLSDYVDLRTLDCESQKFEVSTSRILAGEGAKAIFQPLDGETVKAKLDLDAKVLVLRPGKDLVRSAEIILEIEDDIDVQYQLKKSPMGKSSEIRWGRKQLEIVRTPEGLTFLKGSVTNAVTGTYFITVQQESHE